MRILNLTRGKHQSRYSCQHQGSCLPAAAPRGMPPRHPTAPCPSPTAERSRSGSVYLQTFSAAAGSFERLPQIGDSLSPHLSFLTMNPTRQAWLQSKRVGMAPGGKAVLSRYGIQLRAIFKLSGI